MVYLRLGPATPTRNTKFAALPPSSATSGGLESSWVGGSRA